MAQQVFYKNLTQVSAQQAYDEMEKDVERFCKDFDKRVDDYDTLLTENRIWVGRTKGIGIISAADAIASTTSGRIREPPNTVMVPCPLMTVVTPNSS